MSEFAGRVALVTGSSSGIGEETARRLSALGATVVVNSSASVEAGQEVSESLPSESCYLRADISVQDEARGLIDTTIERYGQLDFLINNAGWTRSVSHDDLNGLTDEIFRKTFDVNVFGTWWLTKQAIPHLQKSDEANIVNITSIAGLRPVGSSMAYAMSKAALNHLTVLLAKSYGPIRVNAVAPGLVATPWTEDWEAMHAATAKIAPVPRSATPDDCAEAVLALLRNKYTSGEIFVVDGGITQKM
ncbi:MAG: SDR family oxidoreductase [Ilumatobacteraceae bacterium]|nr:SDR family oxidoreductase [Ilumatobacteraceae bacterium]